jgi:hypothetical protein
MGFFRFFDRLEDRIRARLSRHPVLYGLLSGLGIVLFFRGVWLIADEFAVLESGTVTTAISIFILLITGTLVAHFVNDRLLASGILRGKKFVEKTELQIKEELQKEEVTLGKLEKDIARLAERMGRIEEALLSKNSSRNTSRSA